MKILISRRDLILFVAAVVASASAVIWWRRSDRDTIAFSLPPVGNPNAPSFEAFIALSCIVLARPKIDEALARRLFEKFKREPWGEKHIGTAYKSLLSEMERRRQPILALNSATLSSIPHDERWFISHLLTTWYLGIYYYENQAPERITFEGALMYDAVREIAPIPYFSSVGYGGWADLPRPISQEQAR